MAREGGLHERKPSWGAAGGILKARGRAHAARNRPAKCPLCTVRHGQYGSSDRGLMDSDGIP